MPFEHLDRKRITSPELARDAFHLVFGNHRWPTCPLVGVLLLDERQHILRGLSFGGEVEAVPKLLDRTLPGEHRTAARSMVIAFYQPGAATSPTSTALRAHERLSVWCHEAGLELLDVLVMSEHRWRSLVESLRLE
jgi:hypothetical protein